MDTKPKDRPTDVELEKGGFRGSLVESLPSKTILLTGPHP